jgi:hypothetical protein
MGGLCIGNGWPVTSKTHPDGCSARKFAEIDEGNYDFIFCAENCRLPGYVSEKFWHGLLSDRVTVYMGHRRIREITDPAAYVFADDFESPAALAAYLQAMTPEQYRDIVYAARAQLDRYTIDQWAACRDLLTQQIIDRINATEP